jgi:AcrR family transcriptional regulator
MSVDARRTQMLDIGIDLLATQRFEDISIDEVIAKAGVSRALFYHYFDSKRDFFLQTVSRASESVAELTTPDPKATLVEQLEFAIDAYLNYVAEHAAQYRAVYQSLYSGDPEVKALMNASQHNQETKILKALAKEMEVTKLVEVAVHGWLAFLISSCLNWLETGEPDRKALRDLSRDVLIAAIGSAVAAD